MTVGGEVGAQERVSGAVSAVGRLEKEDPWTTEACSGKVSSYTPIAILIGM